MREIIGERALEAKVAAKELFAYADPAWYDAEFAQTYIRWYDRAGKCLYVTTNFGPMVANGDEPSLQDELSRRRTDLETDESAARAFLA